MMFSQRAIILAALFSFIAIVLPYGYAITIGLGSANLIIAGLFWEYIDSFYFTGFRFLMLEQFLSSSPYWIIRLIFLSQLIYYYEANSTRTRMQVLALGVLSELAPILVSLPFLLGLCGWVFLPYDSVVPIPIMLLTGIILMFEHPKTQQEGNGKSPILNQTLIRQRSSTHLKPSVECLTVNHLC